MSIYISLSLSPSLPLCVYTCIHICVYYIYLYTLTTSGTDPKQAPSHKRAATLALFGGACFSLRQACREYQIMTRQDRCMVVISSSYGGFKSVCKAWLSNLLVLPRWLDDVCMRAPRASIEAERPLQRGQRSTQGLVECRVTLGSVCLYALDFIILDLDRGGGPDLFYERNPLQGVSKLRPRFGGLWVAGLSHCSRFLVRIPSYVQHGGTGSISRF